MNTLKVAFLLGYDSYFSGFSTTKIEEDMKDLELFFLDAGIELVRVSYMHYNRVNNSFDNYVCFRDGSFVLIEKTYTPDILWIRNIHALYFISNTINIPIYPSNQIRNICSNKWETFLLLSKFQTKTTLVSYFLRDENLQNSFLENIIIKPLTGKAGSGILITTKNELLKNPQKIVLPDFFIVQEFKNFQGGFKDIIQGSHDVRIVFQGTSFLYCYVRTPQNIGIIEYSKNSIIEREIVKEFIPDSVFLLCREIQEILLPGYYDVYALDFGYCSNDNKWYLIEANYNPGFPDDAQLKKIHLTALTHSFLQLK